MFDDILREKKEWYKKLPKIIAEEIINVQPMIDIEKTKIKSIKRKRVDRNIHKFFPVDEEIKMYWGKLGENPFADARYAMAEYFNMDEDLRHSYECNISMFLNDRCNITNKEKRDQLARDLMKLIWG